MGTATDLGLGLLEVLVTLSSTFPTLSPSFLRTGLRTGGVAEAGAGAVEKVTEGEEVVGGTGGECFSC